MTNLTEQWKKGELKEGVYYCNIGNTVETLFTWGKNYHQFTNNKDEVYIPEMDDCEVLAPVPSYEEWRRLQSSWVDEMGKAVDLQKALEWSNEQYNTKVPVLESENQQLKELLKQSLRYVWTVRNDVRTEYAGATNEQIDMLIENIDNAIGEKK